MAISYNIYNGMMKVATTVELSKTFTNLTPGATYTYSVTQINGTEESGKASITIKLLQRIVVPSVKKVKSVVYYEDAIGTEKEGLGTSKNFGGTTPVQVKVLSSSVVSNETHIEIPNEYFSSTVVRKITDTLFLQSDGNKTIKIEME